VIGKRKVYGAIWPTGIGQYPDALSPTQRMMTRAQFKDWYSDCWACATGRHAHAAATARGGVRPRETKSARETTGGAGARAALGHPSGKPGSE